MTTANTHATFTYGRFSVPHTGHRALINDVISHAKKNNGDHYIFTSKSHDHEKNPLPVEKKVDYMKKMFPHANIHPAGTVIDAVKHLHKKGYKHVTMIVGEDQAAGFKNLLHKYNHTKEYDFPHLEVQSRKHTHTDRASEVRATDMRNHAKAKDFKSFQRGVPNKSEARSLYKDVRKGMKLENYKALFLIGGPGSGKDFILRTALAESGATELPIGSYLDSATSKPINGPALIMNGNAYDHDRIVLEAAALEQRGYKVAMVYVYTTDEDSRARNEARIKSGAKTISEATRAAKYHESITYINEYKDLFGTGFFLFDNSNDFTQVNEESAQQVVSWIEELKAGIEKFFGEGVTGPTRMDIQKTIGNMMLAGYTHNAAIHHAEKAHNVHSIQLNSKGDVVNYKHMHEATQPNMGMNLPKVPKPTGGAPAGGHPVPAGQERVKKGSFNYLRTKKFPVTSEMDPTHTSGDVVSVEAVDPELDALFEKTYPTIIDMIAKKEDTRQTKQGDKYKGGIARAGDKSTEKVMATGQAESVQESNQEIQVPQASTPGIKFSKKRPAKGAKPPGDNFDSRIGTVPSGGIGLVSYKTESIEHGPKSFSSLRKRG